MTCSSGLIRSAALGVALAICVQVLGPVLAFADGGDIGPEGAPPTVSPNGLPGDLATDATEVTVPYAI